jgi:hypothetical protein
MRTVRCNAIRCPADVQHATNNYPPVAAFYNGVMQKISSLSLSLSLSLLAHVIDSYVPDLSETLLLDLAPIIRNRPNRRLGRHRTWSVATLFFWV